MSIKKRIFVISYSLLLLVTVSFAWINDLQQPEGRYMTFSFTGNEAIISSGDISVSLSYYSTEEEKFVDMTNIIESGDESISAIFNDFAPGDNKRFRADITNNSTAPMYLRMFFSSIVCESPDMLEFVEIGTNGYSDFPGSILTPPLMEKTLKQGMSDGSFSLVDNLQIPPDGHTVSVYFYVALSRNATDSTSGKEFTLGSINFAAI